MLVTPDSLPPLAGEGLGMRGVRADIKRNSCSIPLTPTPLPPAGEVLLIALLGA